MATIEIVNVSDDLDPRIKNNVETVTFQIDGKTYEMELGEANRKHLENHLNKIRETYVAKAREVTPASVKARPAAGQRESEKIRAWARQNGHTVGNRGRIKDEIVQAYMSAQKDATAAKVMGPAEPETVDLDTASESQIAEVIERIETQGDVVVTEREPVSDAQIDKFMREIEAESGEPASFEALRDKVQGNDN